MSKSRGVFKLKDFTCNTCGQSFQAGRKSLYCPNCRKERAKLSLKRFRESNPEKQKEYNRRWVDKNRDKVRGQDRLYKRRRYASDPNWRRNNNARSRRYYRDNKDAVAAQKQDYHIRHRDAICERARRWREDNPHKVRAHNAVARSREKLDPEIVKRVFREYDYRCIYCGATKNLSLEHLTPLSRGGDNSIGNLAVSCLRCNHSKGAKTHDEFLEYRRRIFLVIS